MRLQTSDFRLLTSSAAATAAVVVASAVLAAQARPQPGTKLPLSQLEAQMFHVSAGTRLKPPAWPNGARVAVGLSFDVDNATAELAPVSGFRRVHERSQNWAGRVYCLGSVGQRDDPPRGDVGESPRFFWPKAHEPEIGAHEP